MDGNKRVSFRDIKITDGFWADKQKLNAKKTIYAVEDRFEDTGRFEAFRFNWTEGCDKPEPHYYWDSDVAKWLEAAAYILYEKKDARLLNRVNEIVSLIGKNQLDDGYFNIYHTVVDPEMRFRDRDHHELYCLGHLIEAAVAIYECLGDRKLIDVLDKYIDLVIKAFVTEKNASFVTPGHEEIELALLRLYECIPDKKYLDLAMFFINSRGVTEDQLQDWMNSAYNQSHLPVRQQREAFGHSVRAGYLYSGMASAAAATGDEELLDACRDIFDDIAERKMYISGGIGSTRNGEAFTVPYDLPSDGAYTESCAGIALAFFANRMKDIDIDSKYADVIERLLYNGILSSLSLDGKSFFYENPLEVNLADRNRYTSTTHGCELPPASRSEMFGCSCCHPNITRFLASVGDYMLSYSEDTVFVHQFAQMTAKTPLFGLTVKTSYPLDGKIAFTAEGGKGRRLAVRRPFWCRKFSASAEFTEKNGYLYFDIVSDSQLITVDFVMEAVFCAASPLVRHCANKTALMRGPVLYCAEKCDNGENLWQYSLKVNSEPEFTFDAYFGNFTARVPGVLAVAGKSLYTDIASVGISDVSVKLIPYACFANRGQTDMRVWFDVAR